MAAHACLKNEFTEDEKYHNLMNWLNCNFVQVVENLHGKSQSACSMADNDTGSEQQLTSKQCVCSHQRF